jgi:hypothetical protein
MALPSVGAHPRQVENLRIGGGYNSAPDGGADIDNKGNAAMNGDLTVGGFVQAATFLGVGAHSLVEVAGGAITVTQTHHTVETESLAATDDLTTINGGKVGDIVILRSVSTSRKTTIKHNAGNIKCGADFQLANSDCTITLLKTETGWKCIAKAAN